MSANDAVKTLFQLPKSEVIFEDFTCSYQSGIKYAGKMFCCENYICFSASIMGIQKKHKIAIKDISNMNFLKERVEIVCTDKKNYTYCSFGNKITRQRIYM